MLDDSVVLNLPPSQTVYQPKDPKLRSQSVWRAWNRLSRLQKSIAYMVLGVILLASVFYLSVDNQRGSHPERRVHANPALENLPRNKVEAVINALQSPVDDDDDAKEADEDEDDEDEDENKAKEHVDVYDDAPGEDDAKNDAKNDAAAAKDKDGGNGGEEDPNAALFAGPQNERQRAVVEAFKHAWKGYKAYAWGQDHLKPISKSAHNWFGLGLTIVDSTDTMLMMGLDDEFEEAADWIENHLDFKKNKDVNLFETTIRVLGGLLSTYHLSGRKMFLDKAKDLGDRLLGAFGSPSGIPYSDVNLASARGHAPRWVTDSSTSEVTTIQLEFRDLSRCTGNPAYEEAVENVSRKVHALPKTEGLVPIFINANTGKFRTQSTITLGARGDSYYEYLLKGWLQTGKTSNYLKDDYVESVEGMNHKLARRTVPNNLLYFGEILSGGRDFKPKMDELVCFLPGTLALGVHNGLPKSHLTLAEELAYTCYLTFARQPTYLAPEITYYNSEAGSTADFYVKPNDAHYLLRPESIESWWYLYYMTGNKTYQDWGWKVFQGIEKHTKVKNGYTTVSNVRNPNDLRPKDMMESFFLGETLKYLYLLFADKHEVDLDKWVFNTEAHPLPIRPN